MHLCDSLMLRADDWGSWMKDLELAASGVGFIVGFTRLASRNW